MKAVADVIARNAEDLEFIQIEAILGGLREASIIKHQEYHDVIEQSIQKKLLFLQETLPRRGDDAFPKFLECLRERKHVMLADRMELRKLTSSFCSFIIGRFPSFTDMHWAKECAI